MNQLNDVTQGNANVNNKDKNSALDQHDILSDSINSTNETKVNDYDKKLKSVSTINQKECENISTIDKIDVPDHLFEKSFGSLLSLLLPYNY